MKPNFQSIQYWKMKLYKKNQLIKKKQLEPTQVNLSKSELKLYD
jgi:hypothetical protein